MFKDYYDKLIRQLAIDHNCSPADFCAKNNIITVSALNEGRRSYSAEKPFLQMQHWGEILLLWQTSVCMNFCKPGSGM